MNLGAFIYREWLVFVRSRLDLWLTLLPPVIIAFFFSLGMSSTVDRVGNVPYSQFLLPGIAAFSVIASALSMTTRAFNEKFSHTLGEYFSLPSTRSAYVASKLTMATALGTLQGVVFLLTGGLFFDIDITLYSILSSVFILALSAVSISGFFILLGALTSSMSTYLITSNILSLLLTYSSGIFYPLNALPEYVRWLAWLNPVSHSAGLLREALLGSTDQASSLSVTYLLISGILFGIAAAYLLNKRAVSQI